MGPERRGRAVHGRLEVNPSGEEPTEQSSLSYYHLCRAATATSDGGGTGVNSRVTFTAQDSGTHCVVVGTYGIARPPRSPL